MTALDISMPLRPGMPAWPGSPGVQVERFKSIAGGDPVNASTLSLDVHCGTHVDAPLHFLEGAAAIDRLSLDALCGPAFVADTGDAAAIDAEVLEAAAVPPGTTRLLLRTRNSSRPELADGPFDPDYCAVTPAGAEWLVENGITLIGIDYLSIQLFDDPPDAHLTLLRAAVAILEGLLLADAPAGDCELTCMPLLVEGAEAAPARASITINP